MVRQCFAQNIFLLTPLREGRHKQALIGGLLDAISTHAPAGGATVHTAEEMRRVRISTHAPAGGATFYADMAEAFLDISTHAPAGGATGSDSDIMIHMIEFLLTPLREGRRERRLSTFPV